MISLEMNINPFTSDRTMPYSAKSQKIREGKTKDDPKILQALEQFSVLVDGGMISDIQCQMGHITVPKLVPDKINLLLQHLIIYSDNNGMTNDATMLDSRIGIYMSAIMMKSYNCGYNDFTLTTGDSYPHCLPRRLNGYEGRIKYTIHGKSNFPSILVGCIGVHNGDVVGINNFVHSRFCDITVNGDIEAAAYGCFRCNFKFQGNAGDYLGTTSTECRFTLHGDVGTNAGYSADHSTFQAVREDVFEKLCSSVQANQRNKVQHIDEGGKVIREVKL